MKQETRIWLDDERPMPVGYNFHLYTADECIKYIKVYNKKEAIFLSLDNDLGAEMAEGRTVAEFIEQEFISGNIDFVDFHPHTGNNVAWDAIMACKRAVYKHNHKT